MKFQEIQKKTALTQKALTVLKRLESSEDVNKMIMSKLESAMRQHMVKDMQRKNLEAEEKQLINNKEIGILQELLSNSNNNCQDLAILHKDTHQSLRDATTQHKEIANDLEETMQGLQEKLQKQERDT